MTDKLEIHFGRRTYPDDVQAVWGARLIWPNDLLHDRQDLAARTDEDKHMLIAWLNGSPAGTGALAKMREALKNPHEFFTGSSDEKEAVLYEDEQGKIVGSPQGSYGYIYVAGWLK